MFKNVNPDKPVFCDIESHGLYLEVCMVQAYQSHWDEAQIIEYPNIKKLFKFVKKHHTVFYNASYDLGTITYQTQKALGIDITIDDVFYAARTAYPELERYSLDILHDHLGMKYYDRDLDKKKMQMSFTYAEAKKTRKATQDQIGYAKADVYTTHDLYYDKKIKAVIKKNKAYALDIMSMKYALVYQMTGIPVDRVALKKERENLVEKIRSNDEYLDGLNPRSSKQVCEALGTAKSDKDTMVRLMAGGNELAKVVYEQRRLLKADKMLESWDFDRIHTFYSVSGAITGRFSASGGDVGNGYVNTQQISRQYQYMFHGGDDTVTFEVDFGTAELRAGCSIMNDETMYKELKEGKDLHIEAAKLTGVKNPTKEDRTKGKAVSFSLIFSTSWQTFKDLAYVNYGVTFSDAEAKAIHQAYHRKYRGIDNYQRWCWKNYDKVAIESAMGRRNVCRLGTDASNYATQSSIAEATKWAVHFLVSKNPKALKYIVSVVHDAVYLEVPKQKFDVWSKRLEKAMLLGWKEVCKSDIFIYKDIPMPVDVEIVGE